MSLLYVPTYLATSYYMLFIIRFLPSPLFGHANLGLVYFVYFCSLFQSSISFPDTSCLILFASPFS